MDVTCSCNRIWDVALDVAGARDVTWSCNRSCNVALDVAGVDLGCIQGRCGGMISDVETDVAAANIVTKKTTFKKQNVT